MQSLLEFLDDFRDLLPSFGVLVIELLALQDASCRFVDIILHVFLALQTDTSCF